MRSIPQHPSCDRGQCIILLMKVERRETGPPRVWRGPGANFLGASIAKFLRENIFPDDYVVIAFQRLYHNFSYQMSILCPKKQISCPLRGNISPKKMTGAQQKMTGGPGKIAPLPSPLGGPDERSLPTTTSCLSTYLELINNS